MYLISSFKRNSFVFDHVTLAIKTKQEAVGLPTVDPTPVKGSEVPKLTHLHRLGYQTNFYSLPSRLHFDHSFRKVYYISWEILNCFQNHISSNCISTFFSSSLVVNLKRFRSFFNFGYAIVSWAINTSRVQRRFFVKKNFLK